MNLSSRGLFKLGEVMLHCTNQYSRTTKMTDKSSLLGANRFLQYLSQICTFWTCNAKFDSTNTRKQKRTLVKKNGDCGKTAKYASVFVDGSCLDNGKVSARAGVGVYWGPDDPRNVSKRLPGRPQTNSRAEIVAALIAIRQAKECKIEKLVVLTDSEYVVNSMKIWIHSWKNNMWKNATGKDVYNMSDFKKLDEACQEVDVLWIHVKGHSDIEGNTMADKLANEGALKKKTSSKTKKG